MGFGLYMLAKSKMPAKDKAAILLSASILCTGAIGVSTFYIAKTANFEKKVNMHVAKDLGVESFKTSNILIDSDSNNMVVLMGVAEDKSGKTLNFAQAKYRFSDEDFAKLQKSAGHEEYIERGCMGYSFLKNLLTFLPESEFIDGKCEAYTPATSNEMVLELGDPIINTQNNTVNYTISVLKLRGTTLKHGKFKITTPLTEDLIKDPKSVYLLDRKSCQILNLGVKTYDNVNYVMKKDDNLLIV